MNDLPIDWSDAPPPCDPFEDFKIGQRGAFYRVFSDYHYRIYCFFLRQTRDCQRSREVTSSCFVVLFRNYRVINNREHMLRVLYMLAQISLSLHPTDAGAVSMLESTCTANGFDDPEIMDNPEVVRNETLLALQHTMQQFARAKREMAELYFFHGMTINDISCSLRMDEAVVRDLILLTLGRIVDELPRWGAAQLN